MQHFMETSERSRRYAKKRCDFTADLDLRGVFGKLRQAGKCRYGKRRAGTDRGWREFPFQPLYIGLRWEMCLPRISGGDVDHWSEIRYN